jgi:hypothetical protein
MVAEMHCKTFGNDHEELKIRKKEKSKKMPPN